MKTSDILQSLIMILFVFTAFAQQGINYKALIKDSNGDVLANNTVTVQFTILENGTTAVFTESYNPTTDINGIIIINIGEGTPISGDFNSVDWGSNPHFLKTEIDSGDGLTDIGTTEFKTVPYAIHAKTSNILIMDEVNDEDADPENEIQTLTLVDNILNLSDGGSVQLISSAGTYFYTDKDEDGYGNPFKPVFVPTGVSEPEYVVNDSSDCNDEDESINPDATEITDGIDNNCNGEIDEIE